MSDQNITLKTVNDLRLDGDGNPRRYYIAAYQRGYRWSRLQVRQLLEDIREFTLRRNPQPEQFYCLQPIVVKIAEDGGFEVVDGQQRLTTLLLILRYFNELLVEKRRMPLFVLDYETRPSFSDFLIEPDQEAANKNIDFYHLFEALQEIETWFDEHSNEVERIKDAFLNYTKVIWFKLAESDNPVEAFTRLNVGKIPLTNDELIRALFLRRDQDGASGPSELQLRIANEWDQIEKSLQNDSFWYFLSNKAGATENRIGFLFDLLAGLDGLRHDPSSDGYEVFYHFSKRFDSSDANTGSEWWRLKQVFMMLEDWYQDKTRRLFHIVGFLVHNGTSISELATLSRDRTKDSFDQCLREVVYRSVIGQPPDEMTREKIEQPIIDKLESLTYTNRAQVRSLLLLFNIATLLENPESNIRFQFDSFKKGEWDIEHVRSVSPDDVNTPAKRKEWLTEVRAYLSSLLVSDDSSKDEGESSNGEAQERIQGYIGEIDRYLAYENPKSRVDEFNELYETLVVYFGEKTEPEPDHSMANLVLLDANTNRTYKNAVFAVKRNRILTIDRAGIYVPLCTRNVFLKVYSEQVKNALFWNDQDRRSYFNTMTKTLTNFFLGITETVQ